MDFEDLRAGLAAAVPFNATLGIAYDEISRERAVLRLPDRPELHNHVGGPHAGAMFSLGESASGGIVVANFVELLGSVTPLAASGEITYARSRRATSPRRRPSAATATRSSPNSTVRAAPASPCTSRWPTATARRPR